jgi:hypothetical protein
MGAAPPHLLENRSKSWMGGIDYSIRKRWKTNFESLAVSIIYAILKR